MKRNKLPQDWQLGSWLSAALDDLDVCGEMKKDINNWMDTFDYDSPESKKAMDDNVNDISVPVKRDVLVEDWKLGVWINQAMDDPKSCKELVQDSQAWIDTFDFDSLGSINSFASLVFAHKQETVEIPDTIKTNKDFIDWVRNG